MLESLNIIKRNTFYLAIIVVSLAAIASWQSPEIQLEKQNRGNIISPRSTRVIQ
ncbi:MAG: hypothetical protein KME17_22050 [Cyanosarcina radialis HA8281-LM2]|nr:hypothetical protein [Cyanosarcina radialis HA8281-LM2]